MMSAVAVCMCIAVAAASSSATGAAGGAPLSVWWSAANLDNYVVASAPGLADAHKRHYSEDSNGDGVTMPQSGSSLALSTWWSALNKDMLLTGSAQGAAWATKNNYTKLRVEGFAASESGGPTFVQGSQMWSAARKDSVLAFTAWQKAFLGDNGYTELWSEGWLDSSAFPPSPPAPGPAPPHPPPGPPAPPHPQCVASKVYGWKEWPKAAPWEASPFPQSALYNTLSFDGLFAVYGNGKGAADTFYPIWSRDGTLLRTTCNVCTFIRYVCGEK